MLIAGNPEGVVRKYEGEVMIWRVLSKQGTEMDSYFKRSGHGHLLSCAACIFHIAYCILDIAYCIPRRGSCLFVFVSV